MNNNIKNIKNGLNRIKMPYMPNIGFWSILMLVLLAHSCASIQQPTGGPRDSIPPSVIEESPKNFSTNFSKNEIAITFDEYVKLQNEFSEISVSPEMDERPLFKIKKRSLIITLPDTLEENTTYTINFGKALVDFNESNELKNYYYVFSTGPEIDSLTLSGNVKNAFTLEPQLDATVMLIPIAQDTIFRKHKASIFTRTDSAGNFEFRNQKEDTYRIYALVESNNDRIFNNENEQIAFLKDSIYLGKDTSGIQLSLFKEIPEEFRVRNRSIQKSGIISLGFNKALKKPAVRILNNEVNEEKKWVEYSMRNDSANLWLPEMTFDSLNLEIRDIDTILDTITLKRNKSDEYEDNIIVSDNLKSQKVNRIEHLILTTTAPIQMVDQTKISLTEDSIPIPRYVLNLDTITRRKITIAYPWRKDRKYALTLEEDAIPGLFGATSNEYSRNFTYDESENFGNFNIDFQPKDSLQYIVELIKLDGEETIDTKVVRGNSLIQYKNLPGIKLGIRIIYDENNNERWDTGNVSAKIYPERIWYFDKVITIRPNWEQEEIVQPPALDSYSEELLSPEKTNAVPDSTINATNDGLDFIKKGIIETKDSVIIRGNEPLEPKN